MWEAVDREIAQHALERALVGPKRQEFIFVSNDGDFAPIIMKLLSLGHTAGAWTVEATNVYSSLKKSGCVFPQKRYRWVDLAKVIGTAKADKDPAEKRDEERGQAAHTVTQRSTAHILKEQRRARAQANAREGATGTSDLDSPMRADVPPPVGLKWVGQEKLYYAIVETLNIRRECEQLLRAASNEERSTLFRSELSAKLSPLLRSIGYAHSSRIVFWLEQLTAIGVLVVSGESFPKQGIVTSEEGARRLFALVVAAANASSRAHSTRSDDRLNASAIRRALASERLAGDIQPALDSLMSAGDEAQQRVNARYLVYCARALGLVTFKQWPNTPDLITRPRLTALAEQIIAEELGSHPEAPEATA
jgi:hypothetical protein